jgi:enoyl-CoA hydratase/carnithine racemase
MAGVPSDPFAFFDPADEIIRFAQVPVDPISNSLPKERTMDFEKLLYSVEDHVASIRLNTPDKLNVLGLKSWRELAIAFKQAQADDDVTSILLSGEGKAFCAGFDMDNSLDMKDDSQWAQWKMIQEERDCARAIWEVNKPVVAAVQGYCLGSGFELSLLADLVIAADDAKFGETELRFSTMPQPGLLWLIGIRKAKEFLMLADRMSAEEAYRVGLVNRLTPRAELDAEAKRIALRLSKLPTETMQITKRTMNKAIDAQGYMQFNDWCFDLLHVTKGMPTQVGQEFEQISKEKGMREALRWMNERYS